MTHRSCSARGPIRILAALSCAMVLTSGVTHASAKGWKIPTIPQLKHNIDHLYHLLLAQLRGPARVELVADEARWVAYRQQEYRGSPNVLNSYVARLRRLQELERQRPMGPWPFVGDYAIIQHKKFRYGDARDVAHYPQFDSQEADSVSTNRFFAKSAARRVEALNMEAAGLFNTAPPHGEFYPPGFEYYQSFDLYRPGPYLLDILLFISRYTGGAQEMRSGASYLIDLRTDGIVPLASVFAAKIDWHQRLDAIVDADFNKQWPKGMWNTVESGPIYVFEAHKLDVDFSASIGAVDVSVPYSQIEDLFRADGPLGMTLRQRRGSAAMR